MEVLLFGLGLVFGAALTILLENIFYKDEGDIVIE